MTTMSHLSHLTLESFIEFWWSRENGQDRGTFECNLGRIIFMHTWKLSTVEPWQPNCRLCLSESVIPKRVESRYITFDANNHDDPDLLKYVSTQAILTQFLGSFYNPNFWTLCITLRNPKWAEVVTTLTTRRRKGRALQMCIHWHFCCAIIEISYTKNPGYTLENPKWAERVATLTTRRRKGRAFQICTYFYCAIIGVSYTKNPGYTLENPKWAERVVTLSIRRRKRRAFQIYIHFYCAIPRWGLLYRIKDY